MAATEQDFNFDPRTKLTAITTLDGRYRDDVLPLAPIVSEFGLIKNRIKVESSHLVGLSGLGIVRPLYDNERSFLLGIGPNLTIEQAERIKQIEDVTRHDVQAMVRAYKEILAGTSMEDLVEFLHYPLTSEDPNNIAYRLTLLDGRDQVMVPALKSLTSDLANKALEYKDMPMLGRTHGQAAVGTTMGKELAVFVSRFDKQTNKLAQMKLTGKFNGAMGNYNAHMLAHPDIDWIQYSKDFVSQFGLEPNLATTQINPYDDMIEMFQAFHRINGIGVGFAQDEWRYISDDWLTQTPRPNEDGSSTMVGKINPIYFERAEGNLQLGQWVMEGMSRKLAQSRLQRDLSDSTVIRNIGLTLGFSLLGYINIKEAFGRIHPNGELMQQRLNSDFSILGEGAQILMKNAGVKDAYDLMKGLTRGLKLTSEEWQQTVEGLPIDDELRTRLRGLKPDQYLGLASKLTEMAVGHLVNP